MDSVQLSKFFIKVVKDPNARWDPARDSTKFLTAAVQHNDPLDMLFLLNNPQDQGMARLKSALTHDGSPAFIEQYVIPFLGALAGDALGGGMCRLPLLELLHQIYRLPGLLMCLKVAILSAQVTDASPVGWFLLTLAAEFEEVRKSAEVLQLASALASNGGPAAAKVAQRLQVVLAGVGVAPAAKNQRQQIAFGAFSGVASETLEDLLSGPGGRHGNDHEDYRSISIMITSDEALCERMPYLPRRCDVDTDPAAGEVPESGAFPLESFGNSSETPSKTIRGTAHIPDSSSPPVDSSSNSTSVQREAAILDREFRLLREDFIQPVRQLLRTLGLRTNLPNSGAPPRTVIEDSNTPQWQLKGQPRTAAFPQPLLQQQCPRNVYPLVAVTGTEVKPRACVMVAVALPPGHKASRLKNRKEREEFWSENGKSTLPTDALVCIARRPVAAGERAYGSSESTAARAMEPLLFCTVVRRDPKDMSQPQPVVGLAFDRQQKDVAWRLTRELGRGFRLEQDGLVLIQVSTNFFSIRPVLSTLQAMPGVPLAEELVMGRPPNPVSYMSGSVAVEKALAHSAMKGIKLDPSQEDALRRGLTQRVALVQGPPGTGKTFVGALLCDAIVRQSRERILVVCYTNHALDQFLEALLERGITKLVRVGGRSKSQELAKYNLKELTAPSARGSLPQVAGRRVSLLMDVMKDEEKQIEDLRDTLLMTGGSLPSTNPPYPVDLWRELGPFLAEEYSEHYAEFKDYSNSGWPWRAWLTGETTHPSTNRVAQDMEQGFVTSKAGQKKGAGVMGYQRAVGILYECIASKSLAAIEAVRNSHPVQPKQTTKQQQPAKQTTKQQQPAESSASASSSSVQTGIWSLAFKERLRLAVQWLREQRNRCSEDLAVRLLKRNERQSEIRSLHDCRSLHVLQSARVIGCTTTGASLYKELLRDACVDPGVVMVEEAGELLEAHVLSSLSPRTKHLIMIGDHKQLRPKVDSYSLSVHSGQGYDLNVSMFERLVLSGFPHTTLSVQHRMHPDVADLIRHTYPSLTDGSRVLVHPPLRGLAPGRRVVFIEHDEMELGEKDRGMWGAGADHVSKVNEHEVMMVREVVRYLIRQGYNPGQLVVLTPYLGQLLELQRELSKDMQVLLDDLDLRDLFASVAAPALEGVVAARNSSGRSAARSTQQANGDGGGRSGVRVATIDNYQGEEADVVVASLVRSNPAGSVGFLREPERINVLLSRARHGMILIGSATTLKNAKSTEGRRHWGHVLGKLEARGAVLRGLPAACQRHGTERLLDSPAAFLTHSPDGGCSRPCNQPLKCGHRCRLRCHAFDPDHERMICCEEVVGYCPQGHIVTRKCSTDARDAVCSTCVEIQQVQEQERAAMARLEEMAARQRLEAEVEAARLRGCIDALCKRQERLEAERAARREAVGLELQRKKMEKQLELEMKYSAMEMKTWEDEQQKAASAELADMEVEALAAAEIRREMDAAAQVLKAEMRSREKSRETDLQRLANESRRLLQATSQKLESAEAKARQDVQYHGSMSGWKEAVAVAAQDEVPEEGLETLRLKLAGAKAPNTATVLDLMFGGTGDGAIGRCLLEYSATHTPGTNLEVSKAGADARWSTSTSLKRALALIQEGNWIEALKNLTALTDRAAQQDSTAPASKPDPDPVTAALIRICRLKLGLAPTDDAGADTLRISKLAGGRGGAKNAAKPSSGAAGTQPLPPKAMLTASGADNHPAEHLAAAMTAALSQGSTAGPSPSATQLMRQRADAARCVGCALTYLLHPAGSQLPAALREEAFTLLREFGGLMVGPKLGPAVGLNGGGGAGDDSTTDPTHWQERAKRSQALSKLLNLTGLTPVKRAMFEVAAAVELDKERGRPLGSKQYNVRFYGNPGTGKTTVARLYGELLKELGILPKAEFVETSGSELLTGGVTKLKEQLKKVEEGGVLFLDEAYQLNPKTNPMGAQVLDFLLPEMENRRGKLVVVLAGYKKQMEELMSHNEGLPSRFVQLFNFTDYSDTELCTIFTDLINNDKEPRFKIADPRYLRIASRRLGAQRGTTGFGNARAVRNAYEQAQRRQSARVLSERAAGGNPDVLLIVRDDLLGPRYLDVSTCTALRELKAMRGLAAVKQQVSNLLGLIRTNSELEEQERPLKTVNLNRIFLGNPGTGKTTVAGLYGRILRDLGLLSRGDVEVRVPSDFIGAVLGESEKRTEAILESTKGCVLVIDEAYGLYSEGSKDPFREAVIDTIVARVQGVPGDDRCVLLLGYEDQMEVMIRKANPGLARRFQMREAWHFQDYSPEDLMAITREAAKKRDWSLGEAALLAAVEALEQERRKPNFGNAGAVNNLLSTAAIRMEERLRSLPPERRAAEVPQAEDFLQPKGGGDPSGIFDDLIGCKQVLSKLREWQTTIMGCRAIGRDPLQSIELNFRFVGAPGTGKTTVARRVGRMFESLGLLSGTEMVSCSASDFVTGYVNQASGKTREIFKKAVGGVLFIDEAYRLNPRVGGSFMQEALDEIVQMLTEPAFMGKMVVILAGYEHQIEELMKVNPGLKSRFSQRLHFPDFTAGDAALLLRKQLSGEYGMELEVEAAAALEGLADKLVAAPNWSNGRDVGTWAKRTFAAFSTRHFAAPNQQQQQQSVVIAADPAAIKLVDVQAALDSLLEDKQGALQPPQNTGGDGDGCSGGGDAARNQETPTEQPMELSYASDFASAAPPAAVPIRLDTVTAAPSVSSIEEEWEEVEVAELPTETAGGGRSDDFGGLSTAFLSAMQDALEARGHDLSSLNAVQILAADPNLPAALLPYLQSSMAGVTDINILREMVRRWQEMILKQMEKERQLALKKQRPVWRCMVCGRYGCPVAPYIERYEEF